MEPSPRPLCRVDHPHSSRSVFCNLLSVYSPAVHAAFIAIAACVGGVFSLHDSFAKLPDGDSGPV